jgi:tetratricopeptide (TPR) repeat protein/tRNA A-37 threonylcarbamoyl transferase component Bud32
MVPPSSRKPPHDTYADETPASATPMPDSTADTATPHPAASGWRAPGFAPGATLAGRYRIVRFIAAGGMGEVYEAEDEVLGTHVALKTIRPELVARPQMLERFRREILLARRVTHRNVCRIFDLGQQAASASGPAVTFLTMELLRGETLRDRLSRGALGAAEALPLATQMAAALAEAHDAGVVHRDFKAANVMLVPPGSTESETRAVVTDFGLAWAGGDEMASITHPDHLVGTPAYVSPEQVEGGEVTAAADIYALGVVLYEMVTGRLPFQGDSPLSTVLKRIREDPASPREHAPGLGPRWEQVILRCLARDPRDRFSSAREVAQALRGDEVPSALPRSAAKRISFRRLLLLGAVGAFLLFAVGPYVWMRRLPPASPPPAPRPAAPARRSVAVLGFKNLSARPDQAWLSTALAEMLTAELAAGARLRTVPGENVSRMKNDLGLSDAESLGQESLARIRSHSGADVVLLGSYLAHGPAGSQQLRIDLRLQDAAAGESIASLTETGSEAQLFDLVSRAGRRLRESLGAGELSAAEAGTLKASLPANPEAARLYAEGLARLRGFDALAARSLLEEATRADPGYAPAHAALAEAWAALGYEARAAESARRAYEGAGEFSRAERLAIEARFREAAREWPKAVELLRTLWTFFPDDLEHGLRLAGAQISAGQGQDARNTLAALRKLPAPASDDPRIDLVEALACEALSDFKTERELAARAAGKAEARGASLLVARARLAESWALRHLGQSRESTAAAVSARKLYEAAADRGGVALSLLYLSNGLEDAGDLAGARRASEEGLAIRRDIGDEHGQARMLNTLANVLDAQGDLAGARRRREESLALFRKVANPYGVAVATFNLANTKAKTGDHEGAKAGYEEALAGFRRIGNRMGTASALTGLGNEMKERGDFAAARRYYDEALALHRETGDVVAQAICRANLGFMALLLGDLDEAQKQYEDSLRLAQSAENKIFSATALAGLGEALSWKGDLAGARRRHEEALAIRSQIGEERGAAESRMLLAALALDEGRAREAEAQLRDVPDAFKKVGSPDYEVWARALRARVLLEVGDVAAAQAEVGKARGLTAGVVPPEVRFPLALAEGRVRAAAGDAVGAVKSLESTAEEARAGGLKPYELEARLAAAEVELRSGRAEAGRARLRAVESEARARGLALLTRKAAAAAS